MLLQKCNCEKLIKLNCYKRNFYLLTYERIYSTKILITLFIDWRTYCLSFARLNSIDSTDNKIEKNAKRKKVDRMLKSLYLWLNCEAKLQELVHLPNRVQFQIHPLSDVKVGL